MNQQIHNLRKKNLKHNDKEDPITNHLAWDQRHQAIYPLIHSQFPTLHQLWICGRAWRTLREKTISLHVTEDGRQLRRARRQLLLIGKSVPEERSEQAGLQPNIIHTIEVVHDHQRRREHKAKIRVLALKKAWGLARVLVLGLWHRRHVGKGCHPLSKHRRQRGRVNPLIETVQDASRYVYQTLWKIRISRYHRSRCKGSTHTCFAVGWRLEIRAHSPLFTMCRRNLGDNHEAWLHWDSHPRRQSTAKNVRLAPAWHASLCAR